MLTWHALDILGFTGLHEEQDFRRALYMIDIGQNDMDAALTESGDNFHQVLARIPPVIAEIKTAIKASNLFFIGADNITQPENPTIRLD